MKYLVGVREVWVNTIEVEADNESQARDKANAAIEAGEEAKLEYSHTLDTDLWSVEEVK